jgi:branched-chain amino acid transport system permease protein
LEPFWTFLVFTMLVVGGMGNVVGAIIGGVLVELVYDLTRFLGDLTGLSPVTAGGLRILIIGVILLAFLHLRPTGLLPERPRRRRCSTQQELKNASAV